jgi:hypothetical protein
VGILSGILYSGDKLLRCFPVWTLKHGYFLIMGGIHLVELPEATGFQSPGTPDAEMGRATGSNANVEAGRVTILTLENL